MSCDRHLSESGRRPNGHTQARARAASGPGQSSPEPQLDQMLKTRIGDVPRVTALRTFSQEGIEP